MAETYEEISKRRQELIRVVRGDNNKAFGEAVDQADADDLDWLLERLDAQLGETPHWVEDEEQLKEMMARYRHQRIVVAGVLGNKKTVEKMTKDRVALFRANFGLCLSVAAILISLWVAIYK